MTWIKNNVDCANAVSWLKSLKKIDDYHIELICDDTTTIETIIWEAIGSGFTVE